MKGIVFTELLGLVEDKFGFKVADKIIMNSNLKSKGVYTSVGTYDHSEIVQLVDQLSKETGISQEDLLRVYAGHFFDVLVKSYPFFFEKITDSFEFLSSIENHIHVEVLKLYPDAELPSFDIERIDDFKMVMVYKSSRKMYAFAEGLMKGCIDYFNDNATINYEMIEDDGSVVKFTITRPNG